MDLNRYLAKDIELSQALQIPDSRQALKRVAAVFAHSADSWFWLAGLFLFWILGLPVPWPQIALLILSILITATGVLLLKFLIKRPRPPGEWGEVYRKSDPHSFPSGHAARAVLLSVLTLLLGYPLVGLLLAVWAVLVILARIGLGVHYLSDTIVGGLIGLFSGSILFALYQFLVH